MTAGDLLDGSSVPFGTSIGNETDRLTVRMVGQIALQFGLAMEGSPFENLALGVHWIAAKPIIQFTWCLLAA
jgi:hypothetical protein